MPDLSAKTVAVIGGGIGGLTVALAFARAGAKVTVFEQASSISEVGAGLQITPNGARVLAALDLGYAITSHDQGSGELGMVAQAVRPMDGLSGHTITRFDLSNQSPAYRFVHRTELITLLYTQCLDQGVVVETAQRISIEDALPDVDLIVGADGIRSVMRGHLNEGAQATFTGQVAWRAMITGPHPPEARIWMLPGRHVVTYPLTAGRVNVVAVEERSDWAQEGWHYEDDPGNLRHAFRDAALELRDILAQVDKTNLWGLFRHEVAETWHNGNVVLLGDAAHPTLPFLAQGANLALEDAFVLALSVQQSPTIEAGLKAYQAARKPRVKRAIAAANANAVNYHLEGMKRQVAHLGLRALGALAPNAFLSRLSWLYDHDVTQPGKLLSTTRVIN